MRFGKYVALGSALLLSAGSTASAAPRMRRGPTAPKLFKARTPAPKPHGMAQVDADHSTPITPDSVVAGASLTESPEPTPIEVLPAK